MIKGGREFLPDTSIPDPPVSPPPEPVVTMHKAFDLQVCVPKHFTDRQVEEFANNESPVAGSVRAGDEPDGPRWTIIREGSKYLGGDPERQPCKTRKDCVHVRLDC